MQCSQVAFVCMYVYVYPPHFNCMVAASVVSSITWYWSDQKVIERLCAYKSRNGAGIGVGTTGAPGAGAPLDFLVEIYLW